MQELQRRLDQTLGKPGSYLAGIDRVGNLKPMTVGARLYRVEQQVSDIFLALDLFIDYFKRLVCNFLIPAGNNGQEARLSDSYFKFVGTKKPSTLKTIRGWRINQRTYKTSFSSAEKEKKTDRISNNFTDTSLLKYNTHISPGLK